MKLAQVVRDGLAVRLHRAAVIQRPTSWPAGDNLSLQQSISTSSEIRAALECGTFRGRNAICLLPMNVCQFRGLKVPPGTDVERRAMIADELAEEWAQLRNTMEFDFWEIDADQPDKATDGFNVSVLAASRHWLGQLWRDCRQNGLDCWGIDGVPLTMARAVSLVGGTAGGRRCLAIDWGYSNTTLCIVADGRPRYSRRIHHCSFGLVLEAIMETFDVTLDEAQHLADTQGLSAANLESPQPIAHGLGVPAGSGTTGEPSSTATDPQIQATITHATADLLDELVRQINRTLQFMESQRSEFHASAAWLMGGGAAMRNIAPYLANILKLPVHVWNMEVDADSVLPACAFGRSSALFANAAALSAAAWRAA